MFSVNTQDEQKMFKILAILQKEIAKRYKKQHSKCYKAPHIIVFIENIENFFITHFETLKKYLRNKSEGRGLLCIINR